MSSRVHWWGWMVKYSAASVRFQESAGPLDAFMFVLVKNMRGL